MAKFRLHRTRPLLVKNAGLVTKSSAARRLNPMPPLVNANGKVPHPFAAKMARSESIMAVTSRTATKRPLTLSVPEAKATASLGTSLSAALNRRHSRDVDGHQKSTLGFTPSPALLDVPPASKLSRLILRKPVSAMAIHHRITAVMRHWKTCLTIKTI